VATHCRRKFETLPCAQTRNDTRSQPLGLTTVDSQFIESRNVQLRDVARAFDVPPYELAIEGENEGFAMVQIGQHYLNGPISFYSSLAALRRSGERSAGQAGRGLSTSWALR